VPVQPPVITTIIGPAPTPLDPTVVPILPPSDPIVIPEVPVIPDQPPADVISPPVVEDVPVVVSPDQPPEEVVIGGDAPADSAPVIPDGVVLPTTSTQEPAPTASNNVRIVGAALP
jgi:hypothetical protein